MEGAEKVIAIERDERCLPALEQISEAYPGQLDIMQADALEIDLSTIAPPRSRIVANLPYGIATELLVRWLTSAVWPPPYEKLVLMFQREVAERICAQPGTKAYGRLSVLAQWRTNGRILFNLPPQAFVPAPKIESSVVELVPVAVSEPAVSCTALQRVTAAAFGQRRKMLRQSLKAIFENPEQALLRAEIPPTLRAEALSVAQFCKLGRQLEG